jgi:translation initiation factor eIF-2B subunit gamma
MQTQLIIDILIIVPPLFHASISDHLSEHYSLESHPRARISLKRNTDGEKEDDDEEGRRDNAPVVKGIEREGTARLLRRFRGFIKVGFSLM